MKAIRVHSFGEPDVLKLQEVPTPVPGPGQVLVRVHAAGVNPVETYIRSGKYGPRPFPFTPGNDCAGIIEALGEGVKNIKAGDRIYTDQSISGTYAELALCKAVNIHPLPGRISFQQGAAVGIPAGTAYRGLFQRGRGIAGETVLIHGGSGSVGTSAIQLAQAAGMRVIATAGNDEGRRDVLAQGAHHAADHQITERLEELQALTQGAGLDLIIELLADKNLAADMKAIGSRGRIVVIGSRGRIEIDPRDTMGRETDILGMTLMGANEKEHRQIYSALTQAMENNILRPVVGLELPLAQAPQAHREVMAGKIHGKIVLIP